MGQALATSEVKQPTILVDMDKVLLVADSLERGVRTTGALIKLLNCSRPTAIKYRNKALELIADETKLMNRDHLRNLEIGRLQYWIEHITAKLNELDYDEVHESYKGAVTLVGHIKWNDYMRRLKEQAELLHKITGLNTEVNIQIEEKRRIVFVRPGPPPVQAAPVQPVQEGELVH